MERARGTAGGVADSRLYLGRARGGDGDRERDMYRAPHFPVRSPPKREKQSLPPIENPLATFRIKPTQGDAGADFIESRIF